MNICPQGPSFKNSQRSHALQGMAVVSSRRHEKIQCLGTEQSRITDLTDHPRFPDVPTLSPGQTVVASRGRNEDHLFQTGASEILDVPTLSRAWPWYHHVGTMNIRSQGPSIQNSQCSHALQGMAVVSSRGYNETLTSQRSPGHCRGIITSAQ